MSATSLKIRSKGLSRSIDFGCVLAAMFVMMSAGLARLRSWRARRSAPWRARVSTSAWESTCANWRIIDSKTATSR